METIKTIYENLTVEELKQSVREIAEQKKTGLLTNGIIRKVQNKITEFLGGEYFSIDKIENDIAWEVCKRWYNGTYGSREGEIGE